MLIRGTLVLALIATTTASANGQLIITAPAAPGGGWDQTARVLQRVLAEIGSRGSCSLSAAIPTRCS